MSSAVKSTYVFALCGLILTVAGCSPKEHDAIVARVGSTPITLSDYEELYIKSNGSREQAAKSTQDEREKFLQLVTKFRLKLADAYREGLDKDPTLQSEINMYKGSLASSFLTDREVTSPGVKRMYDRRQTEFRASHILLNLTANATPEESTATYSKAYELIAKLKAGADFGALAVEHSQDPSAKQNNGDLYYFTAGQMVPPFEDAVMEMKIGEISSAPVRTQFGLHIIKLVDKKPVQGEIKCSHIMIRFEKQDPTPEDTIATLDKIKAIQDSLARGIDFAELAMRNSGDPGSAPRGGDLGWFARRRWIQPFDEVAFTLKPGRVSGIVRTIYGYHLIKCYETKPPKSLDEARKEVQQSYQQVRFQDEYNKYIALLKQETQFKLHEDVLAQFSASVDSNTSTKDTAWASGIPASLRTSPMFSFGARKVSVDSVVSIINSRPDFANLPLRTAGIKSTIDKIGEQLVFGVKAETIDRDYPEFAAIMKDYNDGILLYQIEQNRVWSKVSVQDSLLRVFFDANREKFMFPDRVDITEIRASNDSLAQLIYTQLRSGKTMEEIAGADSARVRMPTSFQTIFAAGSAKVSAQSARALASVAAELKQDAGLKVQLITHTDTSSAKRDRSDKLATKRFDAIKAHFAKKLGIPESRIFTVSRPAVKSTQTDAVDKNEKLYRRVDVVVIERKPLVLGNVDRHVLAVTTDERTMRADSLDAGEYTAPFRFKNSYSVVRLNMKDPIRQKTFDEAGTEVSSAFQEYESKRLEKEWVDGLRKQYPVVEYPEVLKNAFAPHN
ncbi:MAG TPA: peptidylprolyl isomerase [Bacteroidota bacterium]|nr:peptidylprolyl isomerase [Bacteroidota bacterium]